MPTKKSVKNSSKISAKLVIVRSIVLVILGLLILFFVNEKYDVGVFYSLITALASVAIFAYFWRFGFFNFFIVALAGATVFISLEISFEPGLAANFIASILIAGACGLFYKKNESRSVYAWILFAMFVIVWIILAFNVSYRDDWLLEHYLTFPFVLIMLIISRWFKLSKLSYSLIFIFMFLHTVGAHYTYAEVPFGFWLRDFFGLERNHYDRLVHFSFGFLFAYPMRELYIRIGRHKGIWALIAPIVLVLGLSAVFELIEWGAVAFYGGDLGVAYLGTQGDEWDAHKDMGLAGVGSIITMLVTFITIVAYRRKEYWQEIKDSFKVRGPELGELALARWQRKTV